MSQPTPRPWHDLNGASGTPQDIIAAIRDDLRFNRLLLPALPEVAIRIRKTVEDPQASAAAIATIISRDPAMSARLLQVTNSALYRTRAPVTSIQAAIARLGQRLVRNLVCTLAMEQLYKGKTGAAVRQWQTALWAHSADVAALSAMLAREFTALDRDEVMLGGLIHDIGKLPILTHAEALPDLLANDARLGAVLDELHCESGRVVLESWNFPASLVRCVAHHEPSTYVASPSVDASDVVTLANLYCRHGSRSPDLDAALDRLPVIRKLGVEVGEVVDVIGRMRDDIQELRRTIAA